jgi:hypothetical protein
MATSAGAVIAAAAARARRQIAEFFEGQSAFDPAHAALYEAPDRLHQRQLELLIGRGIVRPLGDGYFWFDREAFRAEQERRQAAAVLAFKIVAVVVVIWLAVAFLLNR